MAALTRERSITQVLLLKLQHDLTMNDEANLTCPAFFMKMENTGKITILFLG